MSYSIKFKVKVEGIDYYLDTGYCDANITWNVRKIIELSTGLPWINEANNGLCKDIIPRIESGLDELNRNPQKYMQYEASNGWGTVEGTKRFFRWILNSWEDLLNGEGSKLADVITFWIE